MVITDQGQPKQEDQDKAVEEQKVEDKKVDEPKKKQDFDPESFKAELEAKWKKEIDGLNRRNSLLEKQIQDAEKEKMTEKEKAEYDLKKAREEAEKARREANEFQLERLRFQKLLDAGLDPKDSSFIGGATEEEITERVTKLKERVESLAAARVEAEVKKRFAETGKPGGGDKTGDKLTWDQINKMPDAEIAKLPATVLDQFFKGKEPQETK